MKVEKKVLEQVAEYLGNYVYLLIDPRTGIPFYVGKGTRTRVLDRAGGRCSDGAGNGKVEYMRSVAASADGRPTSTA